MFTCEDCNREFNLKCNFARHLSSNKSCIKSSDKEKKIDIDTDIDINIDDNDLDNLIKQREKKYNKLYRLKNKNVGECTCPYCDYKFTRKDSLNKHLNERCKIFNKLSQQKQELDEKIIKLKKEKNKQRQSPVPAPAPAPVPAPAPAPVPVSNKGIIYLIQPAELLGTNRFKIGCSTKSDLSRCNSYKRGSRYICILECDEPLKLEKQLKDKFNSIFTLIAGKEYFEGDEKIILNTFILTVMN